jgi:hypothetical protein
LFYPKKLRRKRNLVRSLLFFENNTNTTAPIMTKIRSNEPRIIGFIGDIEGFAVGLGLVGFGIKI